MQNTPNFKEMFSSKEFTKLFENFGTMPFDMQSFMDMQRKNAQAVTEAQQMAMQNMQAVLQRQAEILSQIMEDNSNLAKGMMTEGTPEEKISKNAKLFKNVYERTVASLQELSEMINKSNMEATKIINKRVAASMTEIQSSLEKASKKAA
jgi:phasin family protein